jgi:hypothetical protein
MLDQHLHKRKEEIVKKWFNSVVDSYHPKTARFLHQQKDPVSNPVGNTLREGLGSAFEELIHGMDQKKIHACLEPVVKILAIQCESPLQAVQFIFILKRILRQELQDKLSQKHDFSDYLELESKVDQLGLIAFDIYMQCREKLHAISLERERKQVATLLKKAGYYNDKVLN